MKKIYSKFIEIHKNKNPDWDKARKIIARKSNSEYVIELKEVLTSIRMAWEGDGVNIKRFEGRFTVILVAMSSSEDKTNNQLIDMLIFIKSGMAKAAGFLLPMNN